MTSIWMLVSHWLHCSALVRLSGAWTPCHMWFYFWIGCSLYSPFSLWSNQSKLETGLSRLKNDKNQSDLYPHLIQEEPIRSLYREETISTLYREKAIGTLYREKQSAVYTERTNRHRIQRRSNPQCIQGETESRKRLKHSWNGIHVKERGDSEYLRE